MAKKKTVRRLKPGEQLARELLAATGVEAPTHRLAAGLAARRFRRAATLNTQAELLQELEAASRRAPTVSPEGTPAALKELRNKNRAIRYRRVAGMYKDRINRTFQQGQQAAASAMEVGTKAGRREGRRALYKVVRAANPRRAGFKRQAAALGRTAMKHKGRTAGIAALTGYALSKFIGGDDEQQSRPPQDNLQQILGMAQNNPRIAEMVLKNPIYAQGLTPVQLADLINIAPAKRSDPELIDERRRWDIKLAQLKVMHMLNNLTGTDTAAANQFDPSISKVPWAGM